MNSPKTLLSWNVNGLRAIIKKGFDKFINSQDTDIVCLQETKISSEIIKDFFFKNYKYCYWNCADKKGYSGTAILSKIKPINVTYGINIDKHDKEGRVITLEFSDYYLVNVYTPNSQNHDDSKLPKRLEYRTQEWDVDFLNYVKELSKKKPLMFCGDLNVAHNEIDLANPKNNHKNAGFTDAERSSFDNIINAGFIDSYRFLYPDKRDVYTWWSYRAAARSRNIGWRIDYFCCSPNFKDFIDECSILSDIQGSDHCPIVLKLKSKNIKV